MTEPLEGTFEHVRKSLAETREMLYNLLLAPYHESSHYQITSACVYLGHPMRPPKKYGEQRCICGMKKDVEVSTAQLDAEDHAGTR